jgi:ribonuclease P protein component
LLPSNGSCCLSKNERLLKRPQFLLVSEEGQKIHAAHFLVLAHVSGGSTRIGITASRKVGNAVCRNRIRRLVREFFRTNKHLFVAADYNIIAKRGAEQLKYQQVCGELAHALVRLHVKLC